MKTLLTVVFTIAGLGIMAVIFIYSGLYNVSAVKPETGITKWFLETTSDNSIVHHSKGIKVPDLNDSTMIKDGFSHYKEMCESCHGAPGKKETDLAKGLNPHAPNLSRSGEEMSAEELFWVTKNGIKMTGMPAWGKTHSDDTIWDMVAAIKKLHETSPEEYNSYTEEVKGLEEHSNTQENKVRYH